jgi:hypothetical protein
MAADPIIGAALRLLETADRDLAAYRSAQLEDPHRRLAGTGALHGIEYATNQLMSLRNELQAELISTYAEWDRPDLPKDDRP